MNDNVKTVTKIVLDKKGNTVIEVVESKLPVNVPATKRERNVFINKLGDIASKGKASPYILNRIGYIIKELKRDYNSKKWYIPYIGVAGNFVSSAITKSNEVMIIIKALNKAELGLSVEQEKNLYKLLLNEAWSFIMTYPKNIDKIPKELFNTLTKNKNNRDKFEKCLREFQSDDKNFTENITDMK